MYTNIVEQNILVQQDVRDIQDKIASLVKLYVNYNQLNLNYIYLNYESFECQIFEFIFKLIEGHARHECI